MSRRIIDKNWKKRVIFHINALKHLTSFKNLKKPYIKKHNRFKLLRRKNINKAKNKLYHLNALEQLYSLKGLEYGKKVKKIIIDVIIDTILESRKHQKRLQKLGEEMIQIKTRRLISGKPISI